MNYSIAVPIIISAVLGALIGSLLGYMMAPHRDGTRTPAEQTEFSRNLLAFLLVGAFISVLPVLTYKAIPVGNKEVLTYMLGQLSGMATMALGFYFTNKAGQDAVDAKRAESTGKFAEAMAETAKVVASGAGGSDPNAIKPGDPVTLERAPVDLDASGLPWDVRIHATDKSKDADGNWARLDGVDDATVAAVEAELRGSNDG